MASLRRPKKRPISPEEVETFVERVGRKMKEHSRWVLCGIGVICIAGVLIWGGGKYRQSQDEQRAYAYYTVMRNLPEEGKSSQEWEKAAKAFVQAHGNHPLALLVRLELVRAQVEEKNWDGAIAQAETDLHDVRPDHLLRPFLLRYLAIAYAEKGSNDKAAEIWTQLLAVAPQEWKREIYWRRGVALDAMGKREEAIASWSDALREDAIFPPDELIRERLQSRKAAGNEPSS